MLSIPKSGMAGSCNMCMYKVSKNWKTVFQSGYTILHFHQ